MAQIGDPAQILHLLISTYVPVISFLTQITDNGRSKPNNDVEWTPEPSFESSCHESFKSFCQEKGLEWSFGIKKAKC